MTSKNFPYDRTSKKSIYDYAKKLEGHTFDEVLNDLNVGMVSDASSGTAGNRGRLGQLVEEAYFGYRANSNSAPDIEEAGVEIKTTPYEERNGKIRAGERLVLCNIGYNEPIETDLFSSHLWAKCQLLLLIYYLRNREIPPLSYIINYVYYFTPPEEDLRIIEEDYHAIVQKVQEGRANELSESDTRYLGACTKGSTALKSFVRQYYNPSVLAKKRAFCYKQSYMTYVLNSYITKGVVLYEPIIKDKTELEHNDFDTIIRDKIQHFVGMTDREIAEHFGLEYTANKAQWTTLTYRMLGIKSNKAEEFVKANIVTKVIRLEENGKMKENMITLDFKYKEIVEEENWENSALYNYFESTRFFFVVFKRVKGEYRLMGCQFWNMPQKDLNGYVKTCWENTVDVIEDGLRLTVTRTKTGVIVNNNLPGQKDNLIAHVRPHSSQTYYELADEQIYGKGKRSNANQLPDGRWVTNHCFWLNRDYVVSILEKNLK